MYDMELSNKQIEMFEKYKELLLEYNKMFNLTTITDDEQINIKHFLDSCLGLEYIAKNSRVVDIGSGAGFPAIPLKILDPTLSICMLDSLNKRVNFLKVVIESLELKDITCFHSRAEEHVGQNRGHYDVVVARAVSSLPALLEYSLPLLRAGGRLIAYKGDKAAAEIELSTNALLVLGAEVEKLEEFVLPSGEKRSFIIVKKVGKTPGKYPRKQNKAKVSPL